MLHRTYVYVYSTDGVSSIHGGRWLVFDTISISSECFATDPGTAVYVGVHVDDQRRDEPWRILPAKTRRNPVPCCSLSAKRSHLCDLSPWISPHGVFELHKWLVPNGWYGPPGRVHCLLSQPSHLEACVSTCPMSHHPPSNVWRNHRNPSKQRATPVSRNIVEVGGMSAGCQGGLTAPQQETLALSEIPARLRRVRYPTRHGVCHPRLCGGLDSHVSNVISRFHATLRHNLTWLRRRHLLRCRRRRQLREG